MSGGNAAFIFPYTQFLRGCHGQASNRQDQARQHGRHRLLYVTKKNPRNTTEKMTFRKYDPVVRKHVEFKEAKIK